MKLSVSVPLLLLLVLAATAALALAHPHPEPHRLVLKAERSAEAEADLAAHWRRGDRSPREHRLVLSIFVKQQRLELLESTLRAVAYPASPAYGRHLSLQQVHDMIEPKPEAVRSVLHWLKRHGVQEHDIEASANNDIIMARVSVAVAEELLHAQYHAYNHVSGRHTVHRVASGYSLPADVAEHIDFVGPTTRFPKVQSRTAPSPRSRVEAPNLSVTPSVLRKIYNIGSYVASNPNSTQGVASFLEQYMDQNDLNTFFKQFSSSQSGQKPLIIGPNDESNPGTEACLDIEYIMSVGDGVSTQFWYTPGRQPGNEENEPFLVWLYNVSNDTSAPDVFSISYGDNENTVEYDYAQRVSVEFQKAGVRGISLMASSGDGGVGGSQPTSCSVFIPNFPASSPYVTAVGGTSGYPETAAGLSSGGFSNYFARPDYQDSAVQQYFSVATGLPPSKDYNSSGAGFPDVAAQATNFNIVQDGFTSPVDGTSCASPTFSGIVALLNDVRLNLGKTTLGWLNPLFYSNPQVFNDITTGDNPGCSTRGFTAAAGWDPVTGLGTPDFQKLQALVSSLP